MDVAFKSIEKVLIANRGEIAVRLIRACSAAGVQSISVYTEADSNSEHASLADENHLLPGDNVSGYLDIDELIQICKQRGADAVFPGYGFLSEDVGFAQEVQRNGMIFIGPSCESILEMGQKHRGRALAVSAGVPVVPGTALLRTEQEAIQAAAQIGYPVMLKATGGGGGLGLQVCNAESDVQTAFSKVQGRAESLFGNTGIFLEKYFPSSRHVEVQVFGNGEKVVHFGERECSIQRRHQKIIEECPSPYVHQRPEIRKSLTKYAILYASKLKYKSAGTVEFLLDDITGNFFFLEMNTRLQVEHGITEMCYNVDLVQLMLWQADWEMSGSKGIPSEYLLSLQKDGPNGAAIEGRVYAEIPHRGFAPSPGLLQAVEWPQGEGVRVDTWVKTGQQVSPHYDPLIAKVMVHGQDREMAMQKMLDVLGTCVLQGPATNLQYLQAIIASAGFQRGETLTNYTSQSFAYAPCGFDVIKPGSFTTVQDFPGRVNLGHGIPSSGPMDNVSSRIANILVGNAPGTECLEMTLSGPELKFFSPAVISVCGATVPVTVDGHEISMWSRIVVNAGTTLHIGSMLTSGCRSYLAVKGGFPNMAVYLGSKSTTPNLSYGGMQGRQLQAGDHFALSPETKSWASAASAYTLPRACIPSFDVSEIFCLHGPHDDDSFMTSADREMLYTTSWEVGHNSNRTGVRLVGPKPQWSRKDGGAGGAHPSNCFDYGYPIGGMNWGGDSPIVFSKDSPNLGGLICSTTVISADLWRLGQLRPGDKVRFKPTTYGSAVELTHRVEAFILGVKRLVDGESTNVPNLDLRLPSGETGAILKLVDGDGKSRPRVVYRQAGDQAIIVDFGVQEIDLAITCRIRLLHEKLNALALSEVYLNPSILGITVHFNSQSISQNDLLDQIHMLEDSIGAVDQFRTRVRKIRLPAVLDHPAIQQSLQRYMATTRPTAAYLPDNVEYLRKCNGLETRRQVFDKLLDSEFLVVSVGFLLACPNVLPLNPMSQLSAQKFNPTRVSTPGGTIGLGGSLFSLYPVEQPGGYMLLARTLETWDTYGTKSGFSATKPWLWETFDVVSFYEVSVEEYDRIEADFRAGFYQLQQSFDVFDLAEVSGRINAAKTSPEYLAFKEGQGRGIQEQLVIEQDLYSEWTAELAKQGTNSQPEAGSLVDIPGAINIDAPLNATVWKVEVQVGDVLTKDQVVCILEAMKIEIAIKVPENAVGAKVKAVISPRATVACGQTLVVAV